MTRRTPEEVEAEARRLGLRWDRWLRRWVPVRQVEHALEAWVDVDELEGRDVPRVPTVWVPHDP